MTLKPLHIENPSPKLLDFVRKLQVDKEVRLKMLNAERDKYFSKKK